MEVGGTVQAPEVKVGDWVLVHAGFTISQLDEQEARETWDYLRQALGEDADEVLGPPGTDAAKEPQT